MVLTYSTTENATDFLLNNIVLTTNNSADDMPIRGATAKVTRASFQA